MAYLIDHGTILYRSNDTDHHKSDRAKDLRIYCSAVLLRAQDIGKPLGSADIRVQESISEIFHAFSKFLLLRSRRYFCASLGM